MTLHFSQIGFTDDLTFTGNPPSVVWQPPDILEKRWLLESAV
jgi:hypothetical protein